MKTHLVTLTVPLAASASPHQPLPVIQLLPDGAFSARDGRPGSLTGGVVSVWTLSPAVASALLERWHGRTTPLVIDYEHQSLNTRLNGQPAPAAGWIESLGYTAGQGLFASVRWTDSAVAFIERDEYRYISPVFSFNSQTGEVLELKGAALTNTPALDGLAVVATSEAFEEVFGRHGVLSLQTLDGEGLCPSEGGEHLKTEMRMDMLERFRTLLGLPQTASEEEVLAELDTIEELLFSAAALLPADAGVPGKPSAPQSGEAHPQGKEAATPNTLGSLLSGLMAVVANGFGSTGGSAEAGTETALSRNIETALADGRLTRGLLGWARDLGTRNPSALMRYLEASAPLVALSVCQTEGRRELFGGLPNVSVLNEEERFVCTQLGMKEEAYLSQRQSQRKA